MRENARSLIQLCRRVERYRLTDAAKGLRAVKYLHMSSHRTADAKVLGGGKEHVDALLRVSPCLGLISWAASTQNAHREGGL